MSFQAMAWAVGLTLSSREKFVLLMLSNFADENGMAWPSISTLCKITGMSRHTVIEAIKVLEKDNYIKAVRQNFQGTNLPNRYQLQIAPVVQNLHHPLVQEMHHPSAPNAPEPINEPSIYNNKPSVSIDRDTRAKRLPSNWQPSESDLEFASKLGVGSDEVSAFKDYWLAKPKDNTKLDWSATWRNWCRRAKPQSTRTPPTKEKNDEWKLAVAKLRERANGARPHEGEGTIIDADFTRTT